MVELLNIKEQDISSVIRLLHTHDITILDVIFSIPYIIPFISIHK